MLLLPIHALFYTLYKMYASIFLLAYNYMPSFIEKSEKSLDCLYRK